MTASELIKTQLEALVGTATDFFTVMLVVGVLSMSLIQIVKDVLPARRWYQLAWLRAWVARKLDAPPADASARAVFGELVDLAVAGDANALCELAPEQIGAQLNAAGRVMLDYPHRHQDALRVLAAPGVRAAPLTPGDDPDLVFLIEFATQHEGGSTGELPPDERQRLTDTRNRVNQRIQRNLDAIQIALASAWKRWLQWIAYAITPAAVLIGAFALDAEQARQTWLRLIFVSLLGAFVAPIARDLVVALQGVRGKLK